MDPRHHKRIIIVQQLFSRSFAGAEKSNLNTIHPVTEEILAKSKKIDARIAEYAPKFPLERIAKVDLAILRLAVYELLIKPQEPTKVIINEAVELAKQFGGEKSYAFVNAVLGKIVTKPKK